jgi:hypothetical protein
VQNEYSWLKRFRPQLAISFCLCLVVVGCTKPQPPSNTTPKPGVTSTGVVKATPLTTSLAKGESGEAIVRLKIDNGYHVNANPPSFSYLIATELDLTPPTGISVDFVTYPNGLSKKFSFSDQPLAVYEGETDIKVRLTAAKTAQPGEHNLSAKLRVQACDDQVCYAPGTTELTLPVTIR